MSIITDVHDPSGPSGHLPALCAGRKDFYIKLSEAA
jgi:hypothetical protein